MSITFAQATQLLSSICIVLPDELDCDSCFGLIAEYVDGQFGISRRSSSAEAVETHLSQCPCCRYEYATLVEALTAADEPNDV